MPGWALSIIMKWVLMLSILSPKLNLLQDRKVADPTEAQIEINGFRLQVRLPEIYERGLIQVRYAKQRAQDIIGSWIYHLALCEVLPQKPKPNSVLIFKNTAWQFNPVDLHRKYLPIC